MTVDPAQQPGTPSPTAAESSAAAAPSPAVAHGGAGKVAGAGIGAGAAGGFMDFVDPQFTAYDDPDDPFYLSPEARDAIIDKAAGTVEKWGLGVPAMFLAQVGLPASFVAGQAMTATVSPFLIPFFGKERVENWQNFLHNRKNVELLIQRIEHDLDAESLRRQQAKRDKPKRRGTGGHSPPTGGGSESAPPSADASAAPTDDPA